MSQYFLSRDVYLCEVQGHTILLDVAQDEYLGLDRADAELLRLFVEGWPPSSESDSTDWGSALNSSVIESSVIEPPPLLTTMVASGLLTTNTAHGKGATPVRVPQPKRALIDGYEDVVPKARFKDVLNFLRSYLIAVSMLRTRPLKQVVRRVAARTRKRAETSAAVDLDVAHDLVALFVRLRPLVFTQHRACLLDSFTLVEFLACYRQFPLWVIGVATQPFGAHCWVQHGETVFNDTPPRVTRFTPILAI